jgi:hypothetical protein
MEMRMGGLPHTTEAAAVPIVPPAAADRHFTRFHTISHFLALRSPAGVPDGLRKFPRKRDCSLRLSHRRAPWIHCNS